MTILRRGLILFLLSLCLLAPRPAAARAIGQDVDDCTGQYRDLNGDGALDLVEMSCNFATDRDTVYVFDQAGDFVPDLPWQDAVDFEDDVWVLDVGSDGRANLILDFLREDGALVAEIYDDQTGDGQVNYAVEGGQVDIRESDFWTLRVVAPGGWWQRGDLLNFNLDLQVDGFRLAAFGLAGWQDQVEVRTDGLVDFEIHVRDTDSDGRPDYDWRQLYLPVPETWAVHRSHLMVNEADDEWPLEGSLLWPLLGQGQDLVKRYGESQPPIAVDWERSRISHIGEFVASRSNEHNWFVYSLTRFQEGQVNRANFENPFAFYDLAADGDGVPELAVRLQYAYPRDPYFLAAELDFPFSMVRYSWDQDNDGRWDYKVGLAGPKGLDATVDLAEFSLETVPYARFPAWALDASWPAVTFVASEDANYISSEGIYDWSAGESLVYVIGLSLREPIYTAIDPGLRGEYDLELGSRPQLYFSPLDRKLHLLGAEGGLWNVDDRFQVRYQNLDGDDFLDRWDLLDGGALQQSLITTHDFFILATGDGLELRAAGTGPAVFTTLPPRDHDEWLDLGQQLARYGSEFAPDDLGDFGGDFRSMIDQFDTPSWSITGGAMRDFRLTPGGFRLVLDLEPGFRVASGIDVAGEDQLAPGSYVLLDKGGALSLRPASPPSLAIDGNSLSLSASPARELDTLDVQFAIVNRGLEDAHAVPLTLTLQGPAGRTEILTETIDLVPAEGQWAVDVPWAPSRAGDWQVRAQLGAGRSFAPVSAPSLTVEVLPAPRPSWRQLAALGLGAGATWARLGLFLSTVIVGAAGILLLALRRQPQDR